MGPARIYRWRKMRRSRAPSIAPGAFFVVQPWADCITNMPRFNLRQAQVWGKYDPSFAVAGATAYADDVPGAETHILDAGHFVLDEATDEIALLVRDFLERLD